MASFDVALQEVLSKAGRLPSEVVRLEESLGRVLAEDRLARIPLPLFDNSAMDGYALRSRDVRRASEGNPVGLSLVGEVPAGKVLARRLKSGEAAKIMTGAPIPEGADSVLEVEQIEERKGEVLIPVPVEPGRNVRRAGEDVRPGERLCSANTLLGPKEIALLAASGNSSLRVLRRPRVGLLTTGDELVSPGKPLPKGKIYNANHFGLSAAARRHGASILPLGVARDFLSDLIRLIRRGLKDCDVLLTSGGVSVGERDLVREALHRCGVKIVFTSVAMKPGKPLTFGTKGKSLVFALPGNPVSALLSFELFVAPCLARMSGRKDLGVWGRALLKTFIAKKPGIRVFLKGIAETKEGTMSVRSAGSQSSGVLSSLARANCLIMLPEKTSQAKAGDTVEIRWL